MLFNSIDFLIFFPIVVLIYFIIPNKVKHVWLLVASYYFYMGWNAKYALLLLFSTGVTYLSGVAMDAVDHAMPWNRQQESDNQDDSANSNAAQIRRKKLIVAISFILNLGILFVFKYLDFACDLLTYIFGKAGVALAIPRFDILLPVGISFYTFQALSYTMDVYRGEIYAEKNFLRYALYVSFFPQLVAGPIERSKNLLKQLAVPQRFDYSRARDGLYLMLWGYFLKIVMADRIAVVVDRIYDGYEVYPGWYLIVGTVLFAFQVYCDFAGYSTIAIGAAKILGINLMENFNAPYLSMSIAELWRRWHISLTTWFRDYVYIPLGGSRKGRLRKDINILIVFLVSGLWHGAGMHFVAWGGINGFYQIIGERLKPVRSRAAAFFHVKTEVLTFKLYKIAATFLLTLFSDIFFRANDMIAARSIIASVFTASNPWIIFDGSLYTLGLGPTEFRFMLLCIGVLIFADICKRMGICIREIIGKQGYVFRVLFFVFAVMFLLTFGVWGPGYDANNFIYFQF